MISLKCNPESRGDARKESEREIITSVTKYLRRLVSFIRLNCSSLIGDVSHDER